MILCLAGALVHHKAAEPRACSPDSAVACLRRTEFHDHELRLGEVPDEGWSIHDCATAAEDDGVGEVRTIDC